jgi:hypothetical protein
LSAIYQIWPVTTFLRIVKLFLEKQTLQWLVEEGFENSKEFSAYSWTKNASLTRISLEKRQAAKV